MAVPSPSGSASTSRRADVFALCGLGAALALSLQGCTSLDVPMHNVANWRAEPDYLISNQYIPPGGVRKAFNLNSCSYPSLSSTLQCSGRGTCKKWAGNADNPLAFCECDRDWADPECRTRRKSQAVAYSLSVFTGFLGFDQFYLGKNWLGVAKLLTFGGAGIWWIFDIIRIGSAPVPTGYGYSTANDLPHFAYVLTCVMFAICLGFATAYRLTVSFRNSKRREAMALQIDEEGRGKLPELTKPFIDAYRTGTKLPIIRQTPLPDSACFPSPGDRTWNLSRGPHYGASAR